MQFNIQSSELRDAFSRILTVVDKKNSRPALGYTLMEAKNNQLKLDATDLEVSARIILSANVQKPGIFCVGAKTMADILRELPNTTINVNLVEGENLIKLSQGDINFSVLVHNHTDFPTLAFENEKNKFKLEATQITDIVTKTFHSVSNDETRSYLNGIFLQSVDSKLRAVATDGHRLSLWDTEFNCSSIAPLVNGIIIPRKGIDELKKIAESHMNGTVSLSMDDSFLYVNCENDFISIRLISREYPKYQTVIPSKTTQTLSVDRNALTDAIRRIRIMSNEKTNGLRVQLKENTMIIAANHPSMGHAVEKIGIKYSGKEMEIGFNWRFLFDMLSVFDDTEIVFEFNNELSPVIVKSSFLPKFLGIVMPLKL